MYIPAHFVEPDVARARALIEQASFGMLIVSRPEVPPEIAHIPFLLDADASPFGRLRAHVARANPIGALLGSSPTVVAVFTGPHAYVTPRWYGSPRTNVPTWNYAAVHAHGIARRIDDRQEALRSLHDLAAKNEAGSAEAWSVDRADATYIEGLVGGIVAFTIVIERLEAKFKLSQNKPPADRVGVVAGLRARRGPGDEAIAAMIEENERAGVQV